MKFFPLSTLPFEDGPNLNRVKQVNEKQPNGQTSSYFIVKSKELSLTKLYFFPESDQRLGCGTYDYKIVFESREESDPLESLTLSKRDLRSFVLHLLRGYLADQSEQENAALLLEILDIFR